MRNETVMRVDLPKISSFKLRCCTLLKTATHRETNATRDNASNYAKRPRALRGAERNEQVLRDTDYRQYFVEERRVDWFLRRWLGRANEPGFPGNLADSIHK